MLAEIIEKINEIFTGKPSEHDKLPFVSDIIRGELLESESRGRRRATTPRHSSRSLLIPIRCVSQR